MIQGFKIIIWFLGSRPYSTELFIPYSGCNYKIETISEDDIAVISKNSCKVKIDKLLKADIGTKFKG